MNIPILGLTSYKYTSCQILFSNASNFSCRLTLVLTCAMKFNKYPHDEQICKLSMESCKYPPKKSSKFKHLSQNHPNSDILHICSLIKSQHGKLQVLTLLPNNSLGEHFLQISISSTLVLSLNVLILYSPWHNPNCVQTQMSFKYPINQTISYSP